MSSRRSNQTGFAFLEAVLVIVIVCAIAAIGWYVYRSLQRTGGTYNNVTKTSNSASLKFSGQAVKFLAVNDWGVKVPLSHSISDAYYTTQGSNTGTDGLPDTVWLGLTSLNGSGCNVSAGPSSSATPVGSIIRVLPTDSDPVTGVRYTEQDPNGTTVDGYYYAYIPWKNRACASTTKLKAIDSAFVAAVKHIVTSTQYLDIKEWGIRIKLADADKLTYSLGGQPNGSTANADSVVSWATLKLSSSVTTDTKCGALGYEIDQLKAGTSATKIGGYYYGFNGTYTPCGNTTLDALRSKIVDTELVPAAITAAN